MTLTRLRNKQLLALMITAFLTAIAITTLFLSRGIAPIAPPHVFTALIIHFS